MGLFRRNREIEKPTESRIEWLARETGYLVLQREGDRYWLVADDHTRQCQIAVRHREEWGSTMLQAWLPIRFPLANPPHGLFGRLLLRNFDLCYAAWSVSISASCEAAPGLSVHLPKGSLSPRLFKQVCQEMAGEIEAFRQELHERFQYDLGDARWQAPANSGAAVPMQRPGNHQGKDVTWPGE